jgi:predicted GNAT family acetyltransferase
VGSAVPDMTVANNETEQRFEITIDGERAELTYRRRGDRLILVHTEVPDAFEGRGIGGDLVQAAVDYAIETGLTIVPQCRFARGWLERHPDVARRVPIGPVRGD